MTKQVSPAVMTTIIVIVVVIIGLAVWKFASSGGYHAETNTAGNQQVQSQFMKTGRMPSTVKPGGAPGGMPGGMPTGMPGTQHP